MSGNSDLIFEPPEISSQSSQEDFMPMKSRKKLQSLRLKAKKQTTLKYTF